MAPATIVIFYETPCFAIEDAASATISFEPVEYRAPIAPDRSWSRRAGWNNGWGNR